MALKKCPRCELNYILDGGELCTVCREEVRGKHAQDETAALCSVCGEAPALPGEDMCRNCLSEIRSMEMFSTDEPDEAIRPDAGLEPEPVSELVEIEGLEDQPLLDSEDEDGEVDETEEADEDRQTV